MAAAGRRLAHPGALFEGAALRPPFLPGALVLLAGVAVIVLPLPRPDGAQASQTPA